MTGSGLSLPSLELYVTLKSTHANGDILGADDGELLGECEGAGLGAAVGDGDGCFVGSDVEMGIIVGAVLGAVVGDLVGLSLLHRKYIREMHEKSFHASDLFQNPAQSPFRSAVELLSQFR